MIWNIFIPILWVFEWISRAFMLIPLDFPPEVGDAIAYFNAKIWAMNAWVPVDTTIQVFGLVIGFEILFVALWGFDWYAKKIPGVN